MTYAKSDDSFNDRMLRICEIPQIEDSCLANDEECGSNIAQE